jgi:hypothetical protein
VEVVTRWWLRLADAVGGFIEEAIARTSLAWVVLRGRSPKPLEKRWWNRGLEIPTLVDFYSWVDDRLIFSVLVWPSLESSRQDASHDHHQRVEAVLEAVAKGAAEKMWSTSWEVDYGLTWDHSRKCWLDGGGHAYDGSRFGAGSRKPTHAA